MCFRTPIMAFRPGTVKCRTAFTCGWFKSDCSQPTTTTFSRMKRLLSFAPTYNSLPTALLPIKVRRPDCIQSSGYFVGLILSAFT